MNLVLPITQKNVQIEPMRAKDEKLLTDKKLAKKGANIDAVLESCVREIDGKKPTERDLLDLPSGDRNFLLYHLRIISYGEEFETDVVCPFCKRKEHRIFDLEELLKDGSIKVSGTPEGGLTKDVKLSNGSVATVTVMDGHRERRLKMKDDDLTTVDMALALLQSIDGESVTATAMDEMSGKDLAAIRKAGKELVCGLMPKISFECGKCDRTHDFILTASMDFFIR